MNTEEAVRIAQESARRKRNVASPTGVNTYWGGTTSDQSRALDQAQWQDKLERIDKLNLQRDVMSNQQANRDAANPLSGLSSQDRYLQQQRTLENANLSGENALRKSAGELQQQSLFTEFFAKPGKMDSMLGLTPAEPLPSIIPPDDEQATPIPVAQQLMSKPAIAQPGTGIQNFGFGNQFTLPNLASLADYIAGPQKKRKSLLDLSTP
jgi:hypothetical protein